MSITLDFLTLKNTLSRTVEQKVNKSSVDLAHGKWGEEQMSELCGSIVQWDAFKIQLYHNRNKRIIQDIVHVQFSSLSVLILFGNQIECIQSLNRIQADNLNNIYLGENNITSLRGLRKVNWQELQRLSISRNRICELGSLTFLSSQFIRYIDIEHFSEDAEQCCDVSTLAKLQTVDLNELWMSSRNRIRRNFLGSTLKRKYTHAQLKSKSLK